MLGSKREPLFSSAGDGHEPQGVVYACYKGSLLKVGWPFPI